MTLWHPFSAQAVGLSEESIPSIHSKPHINAMQLLHAEAWQTSANYLSIRRRPYKVAVDGIKWRFWPTVGREHQYRKEYSLWALWHVLTAVPDVTVINVSGHGCRLARHLAAVCRARGKSYIAMIGGVEFTLDQQQTEYFQRAACIITHTHAQKEQVERLLRVSESRIVVMPLGVDPARFKPASVASPTDELRLLFVGRWQPVKGIQHALLALRQVRDTYPNARLTLIGPQSDPEYTTVIQQQIADLGLGELVHILGTLPYDELLRWYQQSHFLLLPSAPGKESFGMVMVESLACGTPVVALAAPTGGAAEIVSHEVNGLLVQPNQMADAIVSAFADAARYADMRAAARRTAVEQYSLNSTVKALRAALELALAHKKQER